jgi:hypothetical protein
MDSDESILIVSPFDDLLTRVRKISSLGRQNENFKVHLSALRQFVVSSPDSNAEDANVAIRAIGQLMKSYIDKHKSHDRSLVLEYLDFLIHELNNSSGVYSSSIIFALCLVGPCGKSKSATTAVRDAIERSGFRPEMKYRGYQYACAVQKSLLQNEPWSSFIPPSEMEHEWDINRIISDY